MSFMELLLGEYLSNCQQQYDFFLTQFCLFIVHIIDNC